MKRVELARGKPLVTKQQLKRGSGLTRQPAQPRQAPRKRPGVGNQIPQESRDALAARSGGRCEARVPGPCTGVATDWHHRKRRREQDHSPANGLHCCRHCHNKIHSHPELSRSFGWITSAWSDPAAAPVLLRGDRWVLLSDTYTDTKEHP